MPASVGMAFAGPHFKPGSLGDFAGRWMSVRGNAIPWLLAGIAPLIAYHRVYIDSGRGAAHFWGDTTNSYWPDLAFFTRSIAQGEFPLWNPSERGGFPFAFDPQPGVLHPVNWLFVAAGLVLGHVTYALFQWKILVHLSITCIGWYSWLTRRVSRAAALVGALGATFGCYTLQHVHYGLIWPIAFVPWFLTALDRWVATRKTSAALGMGASVGAIVAAGSPPAALYGLIVCAGFGFPQAIGALFRATRQERRQLLITGVVAIVLAALLSLPVILGTEQLTAASVLEKRDFDYISSGSLTWHDLLAFLYPSTSGALVYLGTTLAGLAVVGIGCQYRRSLTQMAFLLGLGGVLLALGVNSPLLKWVVAVFPPVRFFRLVFRYLYLTQIGLAVLAALGTDALLSLRKNAMVARLMAFGIVVVSALIWLNFRADGLKQPSALVQEMFVATRWLGLVFIASILCVNRGFAKWASFSFGALVLADLCAFVPRSNVLRDGIFELPRNISGAALSNIEADAPNHRVWDEFGLGFRPGSRLGIRDLRGYMDPLRLANYETMVSQLTISPNLLERWGVRWVLQADHPYVGSGHKRVNYYRLRSAIVREPHVLELPNPKAPAFFTDHFESRRTEAGLWSVLLGNPLGARLQLPSQFPNVQQGSLARDNNATSNPIIELPARLIERRNNRLLFEIDTPKSGWFVVNEAYFPGWRAWVDGIETPVYRVDGWIRGLQISKGSHRVELKFHPILWTISASVAVALWIGLGALAIHAGIKRGF